MLPIVVTMLLGFVAAWHHDFDPKQASTLNKMVLLYAIPVGLFVQTVRVQRSALSQDMPIVMHGFPRSLGCMSSCSGKPLRISLLLCLSGLIALAASAPAVPFMGPAILTDLFHANGGVLIGTASLLENLTTVPLTILFLSLDGAPKRDKPSNKEGEAKGSPLKVFLSTLAHTVKQPIVWVPVIAFGLVVLNFHMSPLVVHSLSLLGEASGGVALFATGIVLAGSPTKIGRSVLVWVALKNLIQPGLAFLVMRLLYHHGPQVGQAVLTLAVPLSKCRWNHGGFLDPALCRSDRHPRLPSPMAVSCSLRWNWKRRLVCKSNLVHMVWIDGTYDMVAVQEKAKYDRASGTAFGPVDPVLYAQAFGATGMMITRPEEIGPVMKRALDTPGPVVIGVHVDYSDNHKLFEKAEDRAIY